MYGDSVPQMGGFGLSVLADSPKKTTTEVVPTPSASHRVYRVFCA